MRKESTEILPINKPEMHYEERKKCRNGNIWEMDGNLSDGD